MLTFPTALKINLTVSYKTYTNNIHAKSCYCNLFKYPSGLHKTLGNNSLFIKQQTRLKQVKTYLKARNKLLTFTDWN